MRPLITLFLFLGLALGANSLAHESDTESFEDADSHYWRCVSRDTGWEEHWNGHQGMSIDYYHAYRQAIWECEHYHGRCYTRCYQEGRVEDEEY